MITISPFCKQLSEQFLRFCDRKHNQVGAHSKRIPYRFSRVNSHKRKTQTALGPPEASASYTIVAPKMHAVSLENKSIDDQPETMSRANPLDENDRQDALLSNYSSEEEVKEWFWEQHREEIMASVKSGGNHGSNWKSPWAGNNEELESSRKRLRLLDFIAKVQRQFLQQEEVCCARWNDYTLCCRT
jgi:hypothetical protein